MIFMTILFGAALSSHCVHYAEHPHRCDTCADSYYVRNGSCQRQHLPNCLVYQRNANLCLKCRDNCLLWRGTCILRGVQMGRYRPAQMLGLAPPQTVAYTHAHPPSMVPHTHIIQRTPAHYHTSAPMANPRYSIAFCSTYAVGGSCACCNTGYYPCSSGHQCIHQNVLHCKTYAPNSNICIECLPDHVLINSNTCIYQKVANCLLYVLNHPFCQVCAHGFYLASQSNCAPVGILNCIAYKPNTNECTACACTHALLNSYTCALRTDPFCLVYMANSLQCETCIPNYYPDFNKICRAGTIPFCHRYVHNQNVCAECEELFDLIAPGLQCKAPKMDKCCNPSQMGVPCLQCQFGYRPIHGGNICAWNPFVRLQLNNGGTYLDWTPGGANLHTPISQSLLANLANRCIKLVQAGDKYYIYTGDSTYYLIEDSGNNLKWSNTNPPTPTAFEVVCNTMDGTYTFKGASTYLSNWGATGVVNIAGSDRIKLTWCNP